MKGSIIIGGGRVVVSAYVRDADLFRDHAGAGLVVERPRARLEHRIRAHVANSARATMAAKVACASPSAADGSLAVKVLGLRRRPWPQKISRQSPVRDCCDASFGSDRRVSGLVAGTVYLKQLTHS
jgi:hypothetical protein